MQKSDQPLGLIGLLFALSVGFRGHDMATFYKNGPLGPVFSNLSTRLFLSSSISLLAKQICLFDKAAMLTAVHGPTHSAVKGGAHG